MDELNLTALGMHPLDTTVYGALLQRPDLETADLRTSLGLDEAALQLCLKRLDQHGMISLNAYGEPVVANPEIGIGRLVERRLKALQNEQLEVLSSSHSVIRRELEWRTRQALDKHVDHREGAEPVYNRADELAFFARHEVLSMQPGSSSLSADDIATTRQSDMRCLRRGIALRALVHRQTLQNAATAEHLTELIENGAQVRFLGGRFERMLIFDEDTALVQSAPDSTAHSALLVHQAGLIRALQSYFDRCWSEAADARPVLLPDTGEDARLDALHLMVLQVMTRADKDETGAREMGISVRTYRGHIARLLQRLNAATRFQAALLARDRGWI